MNNVSTEAQKRRAVSCIEAIETGAEQRAQLVLVILDLKPAAELILYPWNSAPEQVGRLLSEAGLMFERRLRNQEEKSFAEYAISKDRNLVEELLKQNTPAQYGALMGYPKTAIDAFVEGTIYEGELPDDIDNSLFRLKFSKDNYEQEFELIRSWDKILKEYSPNIADG